MSVPAVVVAAPASGSGKTTVATGLIGALRHAGHRVAPFKVGPDYIDPGYHGLAAGRPGRNLDPVLVGTHQVAPLYNHGAQGCDIAVVEGVMGLFDGRIGGTTEASTAETVAEGSTAHVATLLHAPVILVVDARGHSQSLAAVLHGFATFDADVRLGGVVLNRVGSPRHEQVLREACVRVGLPVLGAIPRMPELAVPARHLGLIPAVEHGGAAVAAVDAMTDLVTQYVDIEAVAALATSTAGEDRWDPASEVGERISTRARVAIAGGPVFTFGYAEHREILAAAGADVVPFDPLSDELPDAAAGLVLPGGFPEEYAADLSANTRLRRAVAQAARAGMPIHAECAGLLYLARTLDGHEMTGVVPVDARFGDRLTLGYRDAVALTDSVLFSAGQRVRGHEFHRTTLVCRPEHPAWGWHSDYAGPVREGFASTNVHASYLHTHPAGNPWAVVRFVGAAQRWYGRHAG